MDYRFRHRQRLHGSLEFEAVFAARCRKNVGPISLLTRVNGLTFNRLGLSVPRRVGNAVARHRIKRLLREAFRLCQNDWPTGYDMVVVVRPHRTASLADYQQMLTTAVHASHRQWQARQRRDKPSTAAPTKPGPDTSADE